ncbi:SRR1-domain-containing protein [Serendipita vermifera]|nr:SRR1-domain-containing protein [Serendipita vermifera]
MGDFEFPKGGKKWRNRNKDYIPLSWTAKLKRERNTLQADANWLERTLQIIKDAMNRMQWTSPPSILCLGLGSPSESRSARLQLALILEIMDHCNILPVNVALYEPVFNEEDVRELGTIGLHVFSGEKVKDEDHSLLTRTLVFMPHCDIQLHQKILAANWSLDGLDRMVLIGNLLNQYSFTVEKKRLETEFPLVKLMGDHPAWYTSPFSEASSDDRAFVALAVQCFDQSRVSPEQLLELKGQRLSAAKDAEVTS